VKRGRFKEEVRIERKGIKGDPCYRGGVPRVGKSSLIAKERRLLARKEDTLSREVRPRKKISLSALGEESGQARQTKRIHWERGKKFGAEKAEVVDDRCMGAGLERLPLRMVSHCKAEYIRGKREQHFMRHGSGLKKETAKAFNMGPRFHREELPL